MARAAKCSLEAERSEPNMSDWRYPNERADLVERLIAAERRARIAEIELSHRIAVEERLRAQHPDQAQLEDRVRELEDIVQRQNVRLRKKAS